MFYIKATAVDSRFEFTEQSPLRYTLLVGKAFPRLEQFTIAFWIKVCVYMYWECWVIWWSNKTISWFYKD